MLPAQQCLGANDVAGAQVDLGLVVQHQLVALDGAAQLGFQQQPLHRDGVDLLAVELDAIAPAGLDVLHRHAGVAQQRGVVRAVVREDRDADAGRQVDVLAIDMEGARQGVQHLARHPAGRLGRRDVGHQQRELVAPEPRQEGRVPQALAEQAVAGAGGLAQPLGHGHQQQVARAVAQGVVDLAEAVEVEVQQRERAVAVTGAHQSRLELLDEDTPVGQAGERVVVGQAVLVDLEGQAVAHPDLQLAGVHGLGQELGRAQLQRAQLAGRVAGRRQHDDRRVAQPLVQADQAQQVEAVQLRHHQVEQDQAGSVGSGGLQRQPGIVDRDEAGVAGILQIGLGNVGHHRFVIDHHHRHVRKGWLGRRVLGGR